MMIRLFVFAILVSTTLAQSGGPYDLSHNVIASGGGSNSTGGLFSVDGTVGQGAAGVQSSNATFSVRGGFWAFQSLAPTAAGVSISGRVLTSDGAGIRNARLTLMNASTGQVRPAISSAFGYYIIEDVPVGEICLLSVSTREFTC